MAASLKGFLCKEICHFWGHAPLHKLRRSSGGEPLCQLSSAMGVDGWVRISLPRQNFPPFRPFFGKCPPSKPLLRLFVVASHQQQSADSHLVVRDYKSSPCLILICILYRSHGYSDTHFTTSKCHTDLQGCSSNSSCTSSFCGYLRKESLL